MITIRLLACLLALLPALPAWSHSQCTSSLRLSSIPEKRLEIQQRDFQPLIRLLGEGLGIPVQMVPAGSYAGAIDAVVSGGVDLAMLGPAAYLLARQRDPHIEAFATPTLAQGHFTPAGAYYHALLVVRADRDVQTLADLRGARVALSDPASTSGSVIPNLEFPTAVGRPLQRFFAGQLYTGSHEKALDALLDGKVEAAFVSSPRADDYLRRGLISTRSLRVLWRSQPIPNDPLVFSSGLCGELRQRIRALLLGDSPQLAAFLHAQQASGLAPVAQAAYQALEQTLINPRR
ncbi:phosphonate ABC transporter, periplasmic phosphonate-binding protein [Pseudomonas flexibilis]|uniref:Phosphonate transport system substrate-binding protein n=1 Tax=Pseudomonas flexibilis TaxID=706570 RepID=A0A1N6N2Y3_9PSED|nr:phosphate/phosphite/phosphonate ABC transporter substrate-binding protein [Pseudomonas flexibilis]KHL70751.1 phosphonate ABC transporter, periplasmic phosphonate-binding protein [Pseudomonas flexibilis]SIP86418.1 phosphonate transport system substrate-binding protein [Pseudomonas flexibilis]